MSARQPSRYSEFSFLWQHVKAVERHGLPAGGGVLADIETGFHAVIVQQGFEVINSEPRSPAMKHSMAIRGLEA